MYVCAVSIAKDFMKNNEQELLIYQKKIKILSLGFRLFYKYYSVVNEFASEAYLEPRDICIYLADSCRPATWQMSCILEAQDGVNQHKHYRQASSQ